VARRTQSGTRKRRGATPRGSSGAKTGATQLHAREPTAAQQLSLVVGIGASAGGLEAFTRFFAHMPANTGMAFVLVQHLDP
jgi:chemotaxis response regulator CheB